MDNKTFCNVFPAFKGGAELDALFSDTQVESIKTYETKKQMIVTLQSDHLIPYHMITRMEALLTQHAYHMGGAGKKIQIFMRYQLSEQYDVRQIAENYKESLLEELRSISRIAFRLMSRAEWYYNEDVISIAVEHSSVAKEHEKLIRDFLVSYFRDHFGKEIEVGFSYSLEQKTKLRQANALRLQQELRTIEEKNAELQAAKAASDASEKEKNAEDKKASKDENKQAEAKTAAKTDAPKSPQPAASSAKPAAAAAKSYGAGARSDRKFSGKGDYGSYRKQQSQDPDVFYGRNCEADIVKIEALEEGTGECCIHGQVIALEDRELRSGKFIITGAITDFTDTIMFKLFVSPDDRGPLLDELQKGKFYIIKGVPMYDSYSKEITFSSVAGIKPANDFREKRMDNALEKRVELHLHTIMSEMDSVVGIEKVIARAKEWGMKALAITDHGVVQAFPIANHQLKKGEDFKIIYGVEGYFVDDVKGLIQNEKGQKIDSEYVVFDIETTGLSPTNNRIIEIGAVRIKDGRIQDTFSEFVNPEVPIPYTITKLTSITDAMVQNAPTIEVILPKFLEYIGDASVVAHNATFDTGFIRENAKRLGLVFDSTIVDTMTLAHILLPELGKYTLDRLCKQFGVVNEHHHRACDDAAATAEIFVKMIKMIKEKGITTIHELNEAGAASPDAIRKAKTYHGIILAANEVGRVNLYRLISESHLTYFNRRPRMPKSLINKYREGLIIGSACEAGELYRAVLYGEGEDEITRLCNFYDYYEIQPVGNNMFLLDDEKAPVKTVEDLQDVNRKICDLGKQFGKPVVATCDVHFLDPEDEIYRRIMMAGKGFHDADRQPPLFFRTTDEMLAEFQYLGSDLAKEVVITNTNKINDMIERISPVRPDKCPPIIDNSDETLTTICYDKAHEIYGPNLPEIVEARLKRELHSIISNGFAVMYIIAQKLVWKSNGDGYLVGSRGSVGSSFVATMAGITEVNPLPAHYICPKCYFTDFDSDFVKQFEGQSGCDMPDRKCPKCGTLMTKEGHDIPFETFLGFYGDKEPDIDLNFSGEYQPKAHAYTEELFGKGKAFRAGTIGSLAEKTAFGYVYKYYEEHEQVKRRCEMERIALGLTGVKRTTGQHPGGIVVVPLDMDVHDFTPVQYPANNPNATWKTTHFDFHQIHDNILKFDILGHVDPTAMKMLERITGVNVRQIPMNDQATMAIFSTTESLKIDTTKYNEVTGAAGIPEFGTPFVRGILELTKPTTFAELVTISGLSHGTDVWLGNAKDLIDNGTCKLNEVIGCRDDIMVDLMGYGVKPKLSFTIMESVRKGKGLKDEWVTEMKANNVPEWFIDSCTKIKYMFPKAHAVAYVMMAVRIAWFKVHMPVHYYCMYFSIRCDAYDVQTMIQGEAAIRQRMADIKHMKEDKTQKPSDKELAIYDTLELALEMVLRGFRFSNISINRSAATEFIVDPDDPKAIIPPFTSIDGLGSNVGLSVVKAREEKPFLSKEDVLKRTQLSKTLVEKLADMNALEGLDEENQMTLF